MTEKNDTVSMLELINVSKSFENGSGTIHAVHHLSMSVSEGEMLVLAGPSGCGKSTTLRLIAGLDVPSSGEMLLDGRPLTPVPPEKRDLALAFQAAALYPHMTARENLAFGLKVRKLPRGEIEQRVESATQLLHLEKCLDRLPGELSGGECQRVSLGRALVRRPRILLLDEPLSDLDVPMRLALRTEIARIHQQLGTTILYVTHDQEEAMSLGDRIAVLRDGTLQQIGKPVEIYRDPVNRFVAQFFGSPSINLLRGTLVKTGTNLSFDGPGFRIPLSSQLSVRTDLVDKPLLMAVRPESIRLLTDAANTTSTAFSSQACQQTTLHEQLLSARVELVQFLGHELQVQLASVAGKLLCRTSPNPFTPQPGDSVPVQIDTTNALFFDESTGSRI